jgi:sterol desaturase/sphingolipid hydroxylase (fatty acid hydroxylase superfamily)
MRPSRHALGDWVVKLLFVLLGSIVALTAVALALLLPLLGKPLGTLDPAQVDAAAWGWAAAAVALGLALLAAIVVVHRRHAAAGSARR